MARHYRTKRTVDSKLSGLRKRRGFAALFATFALIFGLGTLLWVCKVWLAGREMPSFIPYASCVFWSDRFCGFAEGGTFAVTQGEWYEMQMLVSEIGSGMFGFCLLIDDMEEDARRLLQDVPPFSNFSAPSSHPKKSPRWIPQRPGQHGLGCRTLGCSR